MPDAGDDRDRGRSDYVDERFVVKRLKILGGVSAAPDQDDIGATGHETAEGGDEFGGRFDPLD